MRTEQIATLSGNGLVRLSDRYAPVRYVIRVFQEFAGSVPALKSATGGMNLPTGDVARAMMDQKPVELELEDGRKAVILFTELDGAFTITGPLG